MGHLLWHASGAGTTLEMKVQYASVARAGHLTATARFIRHGRGISYLRSELTGQGGELIAFATSTWKSLSKPAAK
jgi:acyl-coenzyme A thioesterase PaaI-like protein